jgi:putative SOS response-associated peptidase YedK
MCGAYGYSVKDPKDIYDWFEVENSLESFTPRWNAHIGTMNPVIYMTADGVQIQNMYWSFLPSWAKEKRLKFSTFNTREERLLESPVYKGAVPSQRCIIPATHIFEPDKVHFKKPPYPWYCFQQKNKELFGIAGLYNVWTDPKTEEKLFTYTMITTEPNAVVGQVHDREPAFLRREIQKSWLNPDISEPEHIMPMLELYPAENMEGWRVPDDAKSPKNDNAEVIKPIDGERIVAV